MNYTTEEVHISVIRVGDTIIHDEKMKTISNSSISRIVGMGISLFGDTYSLGHKPVTKVNFKRH